MGDSMPTSHLIFKQYKWRKAQETQANYLSMRQYNSKLRLVGEFYSFLQKTRIPSSGIALDKGRIIVLAVIS
jgi:hypothetical protein